jgi:hypothetical protein
VTLCSDQCSSHQPAATLPSVPLPAVTSAVLINLPLHSRLSLYLQ